MIFLWVPETKQRTLEELDYVFAVPTKVFVKYQTSKAAPYWFKRYVLFQKGATLEPLYHFDAIHEQHEDEKVAAEFAENSNEKFSAATAHNTNTTKTDPHSDDIDKI